MDEPEPQNSARQPKLRWYQYSLGTLLGLTLVCCVALGWWRWQTFGEPDQFISFKTELRDSARRNYETALDLYRAGRLPDDDVYQWSLAWMDRERALGKSREQELRAIRDHVERIRLLCRSMRERSALVKAAYWLTSAELLLAQTDAHERERLLQASCDRRQLQGIWKVKSEMAGGQSVEKREFNSITVADRVADVASGGSGEFGLLTIDACSTPKKFEIFAVNDDYPYKCAGSYQLDGDVWTLTLDNKTVVVLERQKR